MTSASVSIEGVTMAPLELAKLWVHHWMALLFPLSALAFLWTGPHPWYVAPLFIVPFGVFHYLDTRSHYERREPVDSVASWPFDLLVYVLAGLQLLVIYEVAVMFSHQVVFSLDTLMIFVVVGGSSGFSIITAHELIHRKGFWPQQLGRLLLCTVLYEHFYTEHLRGHHVRVGTADDPATARFGETYRAFWRRTVPAQFKSAWKLEAARLGDADMSLFDPRMLSNRMLQGIVVEWGLALAIWAYFGLVPFVAFLLQAFMAVRALEAVNYFEHWGLRRTGRRVRPVDSWDTHSWFTYYGLVGLSRHADHHAYPSRPYQALRVWEEAPVLPVGYVALVDMVISRNADFRQIATDELQRRGLGPFADGAGPLHEAEPERGLSAAIVRAWQKLPPAIRPVAVAALFVLAVSLGASFEAGPSVTYLETVLRTGSILAIFVGVMFSRVQIQKLVQNDWVSWGLAISLLVVIGRLTEPLLG
jgi:alkane 1-monooxygenase